MKQIKKQYAANAVQTALESLFEAEVLREAAEFIESSDHDCSEAHTQIEILNNIAGERAGSAFEAIDYVNDYFKQKSAKKTKKKLAVVKAKAA